MLIELPGMGGRSISRLLQLARARGIAPHELTSLPLSALAKDHRLAARSIARLSCDHGAHEARCRALLREITAARIAVNTPGGASYPARWETRLGEHRPGFAFSYGNSALLNRPTVSLLTSGEISDRTMVAAARVTRAAADDGFAVVTSGMKGTYRIVTSAARAHSTPRVVVLDRGILAAFGSHLDRDPFGIGQGLLEFETTRTLVLSTFRLRDHAAPSNGHRRDELVAALSDVIVAVDIRDGGRMEGTCLRALDRGQCVLSWRANNAALIAAGAATLDEDDLGSGLGRFVQAG